MLKIMLDAGHYAKYNRSPGCPDYWESLMTWKLHKLWIKEFTKYEGVTVGVTRTDQKKDMDVYYRGTAAKGYDVFFSLHSNSVGGSSPNEKIDHPIVIHQLDDQCSLPMLLSDCVARIMQTHEAARTGVRQNTSGGEYYGVLRGSKRVGVRGYIVEHSFHSCTRMARWLLDDNNLAKLAEAEVALIAEFYGLKKKNTEEDIMVEELTKKIDALEKKVAELEKPNKIYHYWDQIKKEIPWAYKPLKALYDKGIFSGESAADLNASYIYIRSLVCLAASLKMQGEIKY